MLIILKVLFSEIHRGTPIHFIFQIICERTNSSEYMLCVSKFKLNNVRFGINCRTSCTVGVSVAHNYTVPTTNNYSLS